MKKYLIFLSLVSLLGATEIIGKGDVLVNGKALTKSTKIKRGDTIETKANSSVRFRVANDAFSAKGKSKFKLETLGKKKILNVLNGGVMAVFGKGDHGIVTRNMTAGIRGTGTYTLVKDGKTYFCTCYGHTDVDSNGQSRDLVATHHKMVWVTKDKIKEAKTMENHTDDELRILEKMVGRTVPFDKRKKD